MSAAVVLAPAVDRAVAQERTGELNTRADRNGARTPTTVVGAERRSTIVPTAPLPIRAQACDVPVDTAAAPRRGGFGPVPPPHPTLTTRSPIPMQMCPRVAARI